MLVIFFFVHKGIDDIGCEIRSAIAICVKLYHYITHSSFQDHDLLGIEEIVGLPGAIAAVQSVAMVETDARCSE